MDIDTIICVLREYCQQTGAHIDLHIVDAPLREMQAAGEPTRHVNGATVHETLGVHETGFDVVVSSPLRPATDEDVDAEVARLRAAHARAA
jgi:hypothetical protein